MNFLEGRNVRLWDSHETSDFGSDPNPDVATGIFTNAG